MRLENCELEPGALVTYPPVIDRPEAFWERGVAAGEVPESLFRFYCGANFFSYGRAPRLLQVENQFLFYYLKGVVNGLPGGFQEAARLIARIRDLHGVEYSPLKELRGQEWDPEAIQQSLQSFKYLVVTLTGLLDQFAEVTALLLFGEIPRLRLGKASFGCLKEFCERDLPAASGIVQPTRHYAEQMRTALRREIVREGPDKQWLDLLYLFRNKLAHLGNFMFPAVGTPNSEGEYFTFLPRHWPRVLEANIEAHSAPPDDNRFRRVFIDALVRQDLIEYGAGLADRIRSLLGIGFEVLTEAYEAMRNLDPLEPALAKLKEAAKEYAFERFGA